MVCIYCHSDTAVVNSRHLVRTNHIWRRRRCTTCRSIFTTTESFDESKHVRVGTQGTKHTTDFSRDQLYISIYEVCAKEDEPYITATTLTNTVVSTLFQKPVSHDALSREDIARQTATVLKRYKPILGLRYASLHSEWFDAKKLARGLI